MSSNECILGEGFSAKRQHPFKESSFSSACDNQPEITIEKNARERSHQKLNERLTKYLLQNDFDTDPTNQRIHSPSYNRAGRWCIDMKCTDSALATFSFFVGVIAMLLQVMSLGSDHWLYTIEPRPVGNASDQNGEPKDFLFHYNSGYWRICRRRFVDPSENLSITEIQFVSIETDFHPACLSWNRPPSGSDDHLGFSKASGAILNRTLLPAILHVVSLAITGFGLSLSVTGHIRRDTRTFIAAILYIISGIVMSVAVMQYICVVDDEMAPKMKQTPEGEASKYKSDYGWSYIVASMSFMCIETCALVELLLFLRRFPLLEDKMILVPGLKDKIRRAVLHHEFDEILPARTCSRSSPRISFSYTPHIETAFVD